MPLSDREQKLLSQLEQQLLADDPRFASAMRGSRGLRGGKRMAIGLVGVGVGLVLIVLAVAQHLPILAVPGFLLMLAGASYAFSRPKLPAVPSAPQAAAPGQSPVSPDGLFNRLEERWERRRDEQQ